MVSLERALCDLKSGMKTGDEKDTETICVLLKKATFGKDKVLLLQMIWVQLCMRRQGVCRQILSALEHRADCDGQLLVVGPIMADESDISALYHLATSMRVLGHMRS